MLTRAGWALVAVSVGVILAGRVFGVTELFVAGAIGVLLPLVALVAVRAATLRLRVRRTLKPARCTQATPPASSSPWRTRAPGARPR